MRFRILVFSLIAGFMLFTPATTLAAAGDCACCSDKACDMPCCNHEEEAVAAGVLLPPAAARQTAVVWFKNPVQVGDSILLGKYIIEHDDDRMAKGLPCTHIYAAAKPQVPVVKFHCVHLESTASDRDLVTLNPTGDASIPSRFASFQFAGETAAHGFPRR